MNSIQPAIAKLETLFAVFNQRFYENQLEKPVLTISPDSTKGAYGWCTSWRAWTDSDRPEAETDENDGFYEINICAEHLSRPFEDIAETLLHEMVHLHNLQRGVKDTSRSGTYHNKHYKEAAEAHGLTVEFSKKNGWALTGLSEDARAFVLQYKDKDFALKRKKVEKASRSSKKQSSRKYICPCCGLIVRATKKVKIACMDCMQQMVDENGDEDQNESED